MADRQVKLSVLFEAVDKAASKMNGIKTSATAVGQELSKARAELKSLNKAQADVDSFRKLKKAIVENSAKLESAQSKVNLLSQEMRKAERPTQQMQRALNRAKREAGDLSRKVDNDAQSLQRMRDALKDAGVYTGKLASAQKDLKRRIGEATAKVDAQKDAYAKAMAEQGGRRKGGAGDGSKGPGSTTDNAVKAGLIVGTIREASDLVLAPVLADSKAQEQLTQIGIKANLSRQQLEKMRAEIGLLAPKVRKTTEELRGGVDFLAASGLDPRSAMKMIEPIGKASHAYMADINDLAQAANSALSNLKIPLGPNDINRTKETARLLDIMAVAGNEGNFEIKDMAKTFPTLTARLAALGQTGTPAAANLASALQVAWKATGDADKAANNIDNLLLKINAADTIKNFKKFGVDLPAAMKKAYAEGKGPLEAIAELTQKATGGNTDKLSYIFADQQAQTGVLSLIQNLKEYRKIRDDTLSKAAQGQVDRDFTTRANDVSSNWDRLLANWSRIKEDLGSGLRGLTNAAIKSANWLITPDVEQSVHAKSVKIGNDVGDGLALGLLQKQSKVRAASSVLANSMPDETRNRLKVRSPSRVFMEIGHHVSNGLALGIDQSRHRPAQAVHRMAAGAAAAGGLSLTTMQVTSRPGPTSGSQTRSAAPITIHVHAGPGMDVKGLAREVRREFDREQGIKDRSSYRD